LPKDKMMPNLCFKVRSLILAVALIGGLGLVTHAAAQERAYFIDLNTRTATDLGSLGGGGTFPRALNDLGQVVGLSSTSVGGVSLTGAIDINNAGQVIALGIPEPESYAMLLAGLGLIGFIARRKKTSARISLAWHINVS
jgi:hypothetical protein